MKLFAKLGVVVAMVLCSMLPMRGEGMFFIVRGVSDNVFSSTVLDVAEGLITSLSKGYVGVEGGYTVDIFNLKDNGEKLKVKGPNYWGVKARDLFGYMEFGGKIGWHGVYSPIGVYGQCYYNMRNQRIKFEHDLDFGRYLTNMVKIGAGIQVVPWFKEDKSLFLELGSTYNVVTSCKTPYGTDKSQFNNGASTDFAIGYTWQRSGDARKMTISLGSNINCYNYFNKDYSNDGGYYFPYANTKSTSFTVYLRFTTYLTIF